MAVAGSTYLYTSGKLVVQRYIWRDEKLLCFFLQLCRECSAPSCFQRGSHRYTVASSDHFAALGIEHLVQEAKVLFSNREESALDLDQFPAPQLFQKLIVLPHDSHAQVLLLDRGRRNVDGAQQEPRCLVKARDVHLRVHVAGEVVLGSQHRALEGMYPFGHGRHSPFASCQLSAVSFQNSNSNACHPW